MAMEREEFTVPIPTRMTIWPPSPVYVSGTGSRHLHVAPNTTELVTIEDVRAIMSVCITGSTMRPMGSTATNLYELKIFAVPAGVSVSSPPPYNSSNFLVAQWKDNIGNIQLNMPMPGMSAKVYIYVRNLSTTETLYVAIGLEK